MADPQRVVVFLDWQNVYKQARSAFHSANDPGPKGQVHPVDLAETIAARAPEGVNRELSGVRIYRGMPDNKYDSKGYDATQRQITSWQKDDRVVVTTSKLKYPDDFVLGKSDIKLVKEKGIDVALALDFAGMGVDAGYEVGVLMSCDQDLVPALERVHQRKMTRGAEFPVIEVAAWKSPFRRSPRLSFGHGKPFCHWLDQETYWGLMDERDYSRPSPADVRPKRQ